MRRSRLNLFKVTSMSISLLGILLIVLFVGIIGYIVVADISQKVTGNVDTGSAYDQLADLKSSYSSLYNDYTLFKAQVSRSGNKKIKKDYANAEMELVKANSTITDVESGLSSNPPQSQDVIDDRLNIAINQLQKTKESLDIVKNEL